MNVNNLGFSEVDLRVKVDEEVNNLKKQIHDKEHVIDEYRKEHGVLETLFRDLKSKVESLPPSPIYYKPAQKPSKVASPCVTVIHITDGHMGSVQQAEEVEGFNEFSPKICKERQIKFVRNVVDWTNLHRTSYTIDHCVALVTGDMISGDIHDELRVTNAFPAPVQTIEAGMLLADQLALLSSHFKTIQVEFIVEDNHSRLVKKPQAKEAGLNSFNYIVGFLAKERVRDIKNVTFNIYPQYEKSVMVNGRRYLITHGHNVKGWAGFPYYGIDRKISKEALARMNGPDFNKFHKVVMGHWHAPLSHPYYLIGGSVSGTDAYDHKDGRHAMPSQAAWMVHPKYGEFDRTDFWL